MADAAELTKEQKQNIMLGLLLMGGLLYCVWMFGISPLVAEEVTLKAEMKELEAKLITVTGLKKAESSIDKSLAEHKARLNQFLSKMPPRTNPMVWTGTLIRNLCAKVGIPADKRTAKGIALGSGKKKSKSYFEKYNVTVNLTCSYHKLGEFLAALESEVPFAHVRSLTLGRSKDFPDEIIATVVCGFPQLSLIGEKAVKGGLKL